MFKPSANGEHMRWVPVALVQPGRSPSATQTEELLAMSFITVFTVSAMSFVLLVPAMMIVVLASTLGPRARAGAKVAKEDVRTTSASKQQSRINPATVGLAA